ncbi:MAG: hypothetical protein ACAI38_17385 [Myxococcota bacterium]|nr:hypothetical protein [Myxococcota bacterium]
MKPWLILSSLAVVACGAPEFRRITYPPSFVYVERRELNTVMWRFAAGVAALDRGLNPKDGSAVDREAVIVALRELDEAAARLPIATATNHPMLAERADTFRRDIKLSLSQVEAPVPDVSLARSVTGACLYCHATSGRQDGN